MIYSNPDYPLHLQDIRKLFNMSQSDVSKYFRIPLGTIKNWEHGISKPPFYVMDMILTILWHDSNLYKESYYED